MNKNYVILMVALFLSSFNCKAAQPKSKIQINVKGIVFNIISNNAKK